MAAIRTSLRKTLTTRLLIWQLIGLVAVALGSGLVLFFVDDYTGAKFDLSIATTIAEAVTSTGSELQLVETEALAKVRVDSPELWFVIEDRKGQQVVNGNLPGELASLIGTLAHLRSLEVVGNTSGFDGAVLSVEDSPVGLVQVLFGGGSQPSALAGMLSFAGQEVGPVLVLIVAVIGGLTIFIVPRVVANSFSSLQEIERVAAGIDIDQRGARLPNDMAPAEVETLVNAMNAALERLDEGYSEKQQFLSNAAHELRTPIAILQNRIELASGAGMDGRILLDVHRLANLAEQLLDLQRTGRRERPRQRVDLVQLSQKVMVDLAPLAVGAGYDPVFETAVDELMILGDSSSLERALVNVVQNAISHAGNRGEILLSINADRSIAISDSGPGVPHEKREWIFEPFHRITPLNHGSGLGLSLVREIMEQHRGSITVEDGPAGGARFILQFEPALTAG